MFWASRKDDEDIFLTGTGIVYKKLTGRAAHFQLLPAQDHLSARQGARIALLILFISVLVTVQLVWLARVTVQLDQLMDVVTGAQCYSSERLE